MNYIVLDLEWNQAMIPSHTHKIPFEIIEIGAVKLDENRKYVDRFRQLIRPNIYRELHPVVEEMLNITIDDLKGGKAFTKAYMNFLKWCGSDYMFCIWGNMDLYELQRNARYYRLHDLESGPFHYYDVQKLFSLEVEGKKTQKTLEYAVDYFHIPKDKMFHSALSDAEYTAEIFERLDEAVICKYDSIDYFHYPTKKEEELHLQYPTYTKYISRTFRSKEEALKEPSVNNLYCPYCHEPLERSVDWFSKNNKSYLCYGICDVHGHIKGRIRFQHAIRNRVFVVKICSEMSPEQIEQFTKKLVPPPGDEK